MAGLRVMKYFSWYEQAQTWPVERLFAERDRLLRETVATAYAEVPFYRKLWDAHGVGPGDIGGAEDLPKLPTVDKGMLRAAFPAECTRPTRLRWHDYETGGSTGKPFVVRIDADGISRTRAVMLLRTTYAGWEPGDRTLQTGMTMKRGPLKWSKDRLLRTDYVSAWDLSDPILDRYLETLVRHRVEFIAGYATSLYLLARRARAVGFSHQLKGAVSWGSNMLKAYREEIRGGFGCGTVDSYGIGEGIQIAAQCAPDADHFHVFCLHTTCEILGRDGPARPGEIGEIVLTRLDPGVMPLIRYAVGDAGRASGRLQCPRGLTLPQFDGLDGRLGDIIATPSGNPLTIEFFFAAFQFAPQQTIDTFQVRQTERNRINVAIVPAAGFEWAHWEAVREQIRQRGDSDLEVTVEAVEDIPVEPSGKRRYVKSTVGL